MIGGSIVEELEGKAIMVAPLLLLCCEARVVSAMHIVESTACT